MIKGSKVCVRVPTLLAAGWIYYINDEGWRTPLVFLDESKTKLLAAVERNGRVGLPFRHDGNKIGTLVYPSLLLLPLTFFRWATLETNVSMISAATTTFLSLLFY